MAADPAARLSAAVGRRFGLTVGSAFLVLAAIAWWRANAIAMTGLGAIAASLVIAALLVPSHLVPVERQWMRLAHLISRVTTPIVMTVLFLLVLLPVGLLRRTFGGNPLVHAPKESSYWRRRPEGQRASQLTRQF
jgi:hypothetical protein